jgi:broad specificity phosphatase PhoE
MIIKLVNHGESTSIGLTPNGVEQGRLIGSSIGFDFVRKSLLYVSPHLVARQTMCSILDGSDCVLNDDVPRTYEDVRLRDFDISGLIEFGEFSDYASVYDRVSGFMDNMFRQYDRKKIRRIIIVSHTIPILCFVARFMHIGASKFNLIGLPDYGDVVTIAPIGKNMKEPQFVSGKWGVSGLNFSSLLEKKALTIT